MDVNGDGKLDIVSGGFEGFVYYLEAGGDGQYSAPKRMKDKAGKDIHLGEFYNKKDSKWDADSSSEAKDLCVYPIAVDWDNDGDLDILFGGYRGKIGVRINEGSKSTMQLSDKTIAVKVDGKFNSGTSVKYTDWDGDGKKDLICAVNRTGVFWVKNTGTAEKPSFGKAETLISGTLGYPTVETADMNGDGKVDLLVSAKEDKKSNIKIYFRK